MLKYGTCICTLLFLLTATQVLTGQNDSPYHLSLKRELLYGGSGLLVTAGAYNFKQQVRPIMLGELTMRDLTSFDDVAPAVIFAPSARFSNGTLITSLGLPFLFLTHKKSRTTIGTIGLLYFETLLINQGITDIVKFTVLRPRPYVREEGLPLTTILESNDRASFFSGHTSSSATACFFFARVFSDYYPDSKWKPYVWGLAASLPALTGYLRVRAGKHYPSDVLTGYIIGGAIGYLVPAFHKKTLQNRSLTVFPSQGGLGLNLRF